MRVIKYKVEAQLIKPTNSIKDIYAGTENYLELEFEFDKQWHDCVKAVIFDVNGLEQAVLLKNNKCQIPSEVCNQRFIRFYLVGKDNNSRIQTNQTRIGVIPNE